MRTVAVGTINDRLLAVCSVTVANSVIVKAKMVKARFTMR